MQAKNTIDFTHNVSGKADVPSNEDNHGKFSGYQFIAISGTINPSGAWYQSGLANVPSQEITKVINSLYVAPANQNRDPIQSSGVANVPKSESSITH